MRKCLVGVKKPHLQLCGGVWGCYKYGHGAGKGFGPTPRAAFASWLT